MKSSAEIFHEYVYNRGGKVNPTKFSPAMQGELEKLLVDLRNRMASVQKAYPNSPPIYIDLINDYTVNAVAFKSEGQYFIGINLGIVLTLRFLFDRMLAYRGLVVDAEDTTKEVDLPKLDRVNAKSLIADREANGIVPKEEVRRSHAQEIWYEVLKFVVSHEVTHIVNGHIDFLNATYALSAIDESEVFDDESEYATMRQTLEMDADCVAVSQWALTEQRITYRGIDDPFNCDPPPRPLNVRASLWSFGISTFFRMLGDDTIAGSKLGAMSHPPNRARQLNAMATASTIIHDRWNPAMTKQFADATRKGTWSQKLSSRR